MRIRDWSSDVCSSDLIGEFVRSGGTINGTPLIDPATLVELFRGSDANPAYGLTWWLPRASAAGDPVKIGRASCRERVCQYVLISVVTVSFNKTIHNNLSKPNNHPILST